MKLNIDKLNYMLGIAKRLGHKKITMYSDYQKIKITGESRRAFNAFIGILGDSDESFFGDQHWSFDIENLEFLRGYSGIATVEREERTVTFHINDDRHRITASETPEYIPFLERHAVPFCSLPDLKKTVRNFRWLTDRNDARPTLEYVSFHHKEGQEFDLVMTNGYVMIVDAIAMTTVNDEFLEDHGIFQIHNEKLAAVLGHNAAIHVDSEYRFLVVENEFYIHCDTGGKKYPEIISPERPDFAQDMELLLAIEDAWPIKEGLRKGKLAFGYARKNLYCSLVPKGDKILLLIRGVGRVASQIHIDGHLILPIEGLAIDLALMWKVFSQFTKTTRFSSYNRGQRKPLYFRLEKKDHRKTHIWMMPIKSE